MSQCRGPVCSRACPPSGAGRCEVALTIVITVFGVLVAIGVVLAVLKGIDYVVEKSLGPTAAYLVGMVLFGLVMAAVKGVLPR